MPMVCILVSALQKSFALVFAGYVMFLLLFLKWTRIEIIVYRTVLYLYRTHHMYRFSQQRFLYI